MTSADEDTPPRPRLDQALVAPSSGERAAEEARIQHALRAVAKPDSRFQWNLDFFIPDFEGSEAAASGLAATPEYRTAQHIFVTPDNALVAMRRRCLSDAKTIVLPSYGLTRGFLILDPTQIPTDARPYAAWLDGIDHFARPASLADLAPLGAFDLVLAGAAAVTIEGLRFGMGHRYLDIEWGLLAGAGLLPASVPVATMIHPVQLSDCALTADAADIFADLIALPDSVMRTPPRPRPERLDPGLLSPELAETEVVREYWSLRAAR